MDVISHGDIISRHYIYNSRNFMDVISETTTVDPALEKIRQEILTIVNQERKNAGLSPLTLNNLLNEASQKQAYYMRETDDFAHVSKNGSTFQTRADAV